MLRLMGYILIRGAGDAPMARRYQTTKIRKDQIIDAARSLIIKYGSEHVTVRRMAKQVGISEAAVYRHFKNKADILSFLVDHIQKNLVEDINKATPAEHSSLDLLDKILRRHMSAIEQRRGISFLIIAEIISLGNKKLNQKVTEVINEYIDNLRSVLAKSVESGEMRNDVNLEAASTLLFTMIQGLVNIWALSNYSFDVEEKYATLWNFFREAVTERRLKTELPPGRDETGSNQT
jgi:AcrR family transcriptional regulator